MKRWKQIFALGLCLTLACSSPVFAETTDYWNECWEEVTQDASVISVTPGKDSSELRFCWLSDLGSKNSFRVGTNSVLSEEDTVPVHEKITITGKKRCSVTAGNLQADCEYFYSYTKNGTWSPVYSVRTDLENAPFTALAISDVQLGRSGDWKQKDVLLHDLAGWDTTLQVATENNPDVSLCLSAGDQAEIGAQEKQYRLFLAPEPLRGVPVATTIGNHEFYFPFLNLHFNLPNRQGGSVFHSLGDEPYYFTKGNALFIVLDTNDFLVWDHEAVLEAAIKAYPDTRWRVVMMHHSLYSCEDSMNDGPLLRRTLSPVLERYGIDLVFSGHTHRYSRSYPIWENAVSENGIVYLEAGCASGCNCKKAPEVLPAYSANGYHSDEPVYSILQFNEDEIIIRSYAVIEGKATLMDEGVVTGIEHTSASMSLPLKALQRVLSIFGRLCSVVFT